jgi:hypothetical protein
VTLTSFLPREDTLRQAWAAYLIGLPQTIGAPYEYWGTLTYRNAEEIPAHHAADIVARRFQYFTGQLNERLYGKRWVRSGNSVWGAIATELHKSGYPHHHFLLGGDGLRAGLRRLDIMDMWDKLYGFARVQDYQGDAATRYLTKYVAKGGVVDVFAGAKVRDRLKS